ncbi:MAG: tRNA (adenosine(37)-N6)-dimethylallyltransferase MiaA [Alphaproteobacteria bacterium]|jgi:tRNA dimethylallyltransferase
MGDAPVIVLAGPTASGKSSLAMDVADALDGTVINADSMQVYADLCVLTARPGETDEARVPHRLYGYRDATEMASAADWADDAKLAIVETRAVGRRPVLVGGTGLYLKALMEGIAPIPAVPTEIRTIARARHREIGSDAFHAELVQRDPVIAVRLNVGDSQRVIRAWEVFEATGRPLSDWQNDPVPPVGLDFRVVALMPEREGLYANCETRFQQMLDQGALEEVATLSDRAKREGLDPALPIFKALGYPALAAHLKGEMSLDAAVAKSQQQTRNYAKRQMTWLQHQLPDANAETPVLKQSYPNQDEIFSFLS